MPTAAEYAGCRDSRVRKRFDLVGNNEKRDDPNLLSHPVFHIGRGNPVEEFSEAVAQTEAHAVLQWRIPGGYQICHIDVHSGETQTESHGGESRDSCLIGAVVPACAQGGEAVVDILGSYSRERSGGCSEEHSAFESGRQVMATEVIAVAGCKPGVHGKAETLAGC